MTYEDATEFVGTTPLSGHAQFVVLASNGLRPEHGVLEVGCGALHLAKPLVKYLKVGRYVGVDPNEWLADAAVGQDELLGELLLVKRARFFDADDFRAPEMSLFDVIFAHSVLSHAGTDQMQDFMFAVREQLASGGWAMVSLRLAGLDSGHNEWVYPGVSYFRIETIRAMAEIADLEVTERPDIREYLTSLRPQEFHDWVVLTHA